MYEFNRSVARLIGEDQVWETPDIGATACDKIFTTYREVYVVLSNKFIEGALTLDLSLIRSKIETLTITFDEFLVANGNSSLPTVDGYPVVETSIMRYGDAYDAGYSILGTDHMVDPETVVTPEHQVDVLFRRDGVDYEKMIRTCLFTVNGLFHRASASTKGVYLLRAGESCNISQETNFGIANFQDIGEFECLSFKDEYFKKPLKLLPYKDKLFIKFPKKLTGKTIFLVLGGFLLTPSNACFKLLNDDTLEVSMNRLPWHRYFYGALKNINLESLGLNVIKDDRRAISELDSDDAIKKFFLLPQSFLVVFDTQKMTIVEDQLQDMGIPGRWEYPGYPQGIIRTKYGFHPEYRALDQDGVFVLATMPQHDNPIMRETVYHRLEGATDDMRIGALSNFPAQAMLIRAYQTGVKIKKEP